jgi:HEAT repeat protein
LYFQEDGFQEHFEVIDNRGAHERFRLTMAKLVELLSSGGRLRYAIAVALGKIGYTWELKKYVCHDVGVRNAVGELGELGAGFIPALCSLPAKEAAPVLRGLGAYAVPGLVAIMNDDREVVTVRAAAARQLGKLDESAFGAVGELIKASGCRKSKTVASTAADALARLANRAKFIAGSPVEKLDNEGAQKVLALLRGQASRA